MNWTDTITFILDRGETYKSIAAYIGGVTPASIRALRRNIGQEPGWRAGNKIIEMSRKVSRRKLTRIDTVA